MGSGAITGQGGPAARFVRERRDLALVTRRVFAGKLPVVALIAAAAPASVNAASASKSFEAIYKAEWAWRAAEFPNDGSGEAEHRPSRRVGAAQPRRLDYWRDVQAQLHGIDVPS